MMAPIADKKRGNTLRGRTKIPVVALCILCALGCASRLSRRPGEHHVLIGDSGRVGEAMITVTDVTFREGKGRACFFIGGAEFKEPTTSAFREALFYEGLSENTIRMSHREYREDLENPFFVTPLTHDLNKSSVFWFLDYRIRVLEATDEEIRFEEIGRPMRHVIRQTSSGTVNIDARTNDSLHPVSVLFAAGSYEIRPVGMAEGGSYNAWTSQESRVTWFHRYCVESDEFFFCQGNSKGGRSDLKALEGATGRRFTLREPQFVRFYIEDGVYADNAGGVSMHFEAVPSPALLILSLIPASGPYGTSMRIHGKGFGEQQSGMSGVAEGHYSFVSFRRDYDSKTAIVTKYRSWSDEEIEVVLEDLFFDENDDNLNSWGEALLDAGGLALGKYHLTFHTVWFYDDNNNESYDGRYERHSGFSSNSKGFELTGVPPVADAGPDVCILSHHQDAMVILGTVYDSDGNPLAFRWLAGQDELCPWSTVDSTGECLLYLNSVGECPEGDHVLTLEVFDGYHTSSDDMVLTVVSLRCPE